MEKIKENTLNLHAKIDLGVTLIQGFKDKTHKLHPEQAFEWNFLRSPFPNLKSQEFGIFSLKHFRSKISKNPKYPNMGFLSSKIPNDPGNVLSKSSEFFGTGSADFFDRNPMGSKIPNVFPKSRGFYGIGVQDF